MSRNDGDGLRTASLALAEGALLYTEYDFMKRLMVRLIADARGAETDTSRDWEYTDWQALESFVDGFLTSLPAARSVATARFGTRSGEVG